MKKPTVLAWLTCALLSAHGIAHAQSTGNTTDDAGSRRPIEITPYVSLGSANASAVGAAVRWPIGSRLGVELETELRRAEITAVNMALSLVYDLPTIGRVTPYVAGGVGLERYGKVIVQPHGILAGTDTAVTVNAGGGIRMPVTDRWGVRSDARWTNGDGPNAGERWRVYNGATLAVGKR